MRNKQSIKEFLIHMKNKQLGEDISGATVKLDIDRMLSHESRLSQVFMDFILKNKDKEFTAMREYPYETLYVLLEDPSPIKWLFHVDDLILIK